MSVLGVVTCEILERELASMLAMDAHIQCVTVVAASESTRFAEMLAALRPSVARLVPCIESFRADPSQELEVVVRVLPMRLHRSRHRLRVALLSAARSLAPHVHALLLTYGMCAGLLDLRNDAALQHRPVFIPTDHGRPVDDCVGLLLGGRESYYEEQRQVPGTFFVTPGWSEHWSEMVREPGPATGACPRESPLERMFRGYERTLLVVDPCMNPDQMRSNIQEFSRMLGLRTETRAGTLCLLEAAWNEARTFCLERGADREEGTCDGRAADSRE